MADQLSDGPARVVQGRILEFAFICTDWQIRLAGIRDHPYIMSAKGLCGLGQKYGNFCDVGD